MEAEDLLRDLLNALRAVKEDLAAGTALSAALDRQIATRKARTETARRSGGLSPEGARQSSRLLAELEGLKALPPAADPFAAVKAEFDGRVRDLKALAGRAGARLEQLFAFCEEVYPDGQELLILVTELTVNPHAARFISRYGCEAYFTHNRELLFYERQQEIIAQMEQLELD